MRVFFVVIFVLLVLALGILEVLALPPRLEAPAGQPHFPCVTGPSASRHPRGPCRRARGPADGDRPT